MSLMHAGTAARTGRPPALEASRGRRVLTDWIDRFLGSDPGLTRLFGALQAVVTIGAVLLVELLFVRTTHALQLDTHGAVLPPARAAAVTAQQQGILHTAMMLGSEVGFVASLTAASFATLRARLLNFALLPIPMIAGFALGLALVPVRALGLGAFVVLLAAGAYLRRFGPRGFVFGLALFLADLFAFLNGAELRLANLGWLAAEIVIAAAVACIVQFTLFYPSRRAALRRMRRSYEARARGVTRAALDLLQQRVTPARASRRLHRRLLRLNETALMIDAQLGHPGALPAGWSAAAVHQRLFDSELALSNMARFAERLAELALPAETREQASQALAAVAAGDLLRAEFAGHELLARLRTERTGQEPGHDLDVLLHRFAVSVLGFTEAAQDTPARLADEAFAPAVNLLAGWLPGSAIVSAAASLEGSGPSPVRRPLRDQLRRWDRVRLDPSARLAIQMAVAITAAVLIGDLISGKRAYWAVITAFVTFMATNNAGEQLRRGILRITGTTIGVLLGALAAHLVGSRTDISIPLILVGVFFGLYLIRISHVFLAIGMTLMLSQVFVQLDQFSNSLLPLRLEETVVGAAVGTLTVLCVLPLRTGRVGRVAARHYLQALTDFTEQAVRRLTAPVTSAELRGAMRRLDASYQTLVSTMQPLGIPFVRVTDSPRERLLQTAAASRQYARNLLITTGTGIEPAPETRDQLEAAQRQLADSLRELIAYLQDTQATPRRYVRAAALFDQVAAQLDDDDYLAPAQLALRELQLIDGAMATLAQSFGLTVRALDTGSALTQS